MSRFQIDDCGRECREQNAAGHTLDDSGENEGRGTVGVPEQDHAHGKHREGGRDHRSSTHMIGQGAGGEQGRQERDGIGGEHDGDHDRGKPEHRLNHRVER